MTDTIERFIERVNALESQSSLAFSFSGELFILMPRELMLALRDELKNPTRMVVALKKRGGGTVTKTIDVISVED